MRIRNSSNWGFFLGLFGDIGRGIGFGLSILLGAAGLGAAAGAVGAAVYGLPILAGALFGVIAVAALALVFVFLGNMS